MLNESVYRDHPGVQIIAEESTAWPMVSRPTYLGGLGFGLKWNMGWMHDTLKYMQEDPIHRRYHHDAADLLADLRLQRELHAAAVARRGGARQGLADQQDAGRRLAAVRQPARCCTATCGRIRARSCCSWAASSASGASGPTTTRSSGGVLGNDRPRRPAALGRGPEPPLPQRAGAARARLRAGRLRVDRLQRRRAQRAQLPAQARATARRCWWWPTSRRCRATTTWSACRRPATGASCSTATPRCTAAAAWATRAASTAVPVAAHGHFHSLNLRLPPLGILILRTRRSRMR